nr:uncharacterized protein LOC117278062 [Nicotiana tomentosiformis]
MEPPDISKNVGRPRVKRIKEPDEARKRVGEWSYSRKGVVMTYSNCGGKNHNARGCFKEKPTAETSKSRKKKHQKGGSSQTSAPEFSLASAASEDEGMDFDSEPVTQQTQESSYATTSLSRGYGVVIGTNEDPPLRPMVIAESEIRLAVRKLNARPPTGTRRFQFCEDADGVAVPSNLPYSPTKATWKGKLVVTLNEARKKKKLKMASNCEV